jgi:hypothetical protein
MKLYEPFIYIDDNFLDFKFAYCISYSFCCCDQSLERTGQRKEDLFWLVVSEGSVHGYLTLRAWADCHGCGSVWRRFFTSWQTGSRDRGRD